MTSGHLVESKRGGSLLMYVAAFSALMGAMSFGCVIGMTMNSFI